MRFPDFLKTAVLLFGGAATALAIVAIAGARADDNVTLLYGGGLSDRDRHRHDNLPLLMAGGGSGTLRGRGHVVSPMDTPMSNVLLTIARKLGLSEEAVGDSNGHLRELDV